MNVVSLAWSTVVLATLLAAACSTGAGGGGLGAGPPDVGSSQLSDAAPSDSPALDAAVGPGPAADACGSSVPQCVASCGAAGASAASCVGDAWSCPAGWVTKDSCPPETCWGPTPAGAECVAGQWHCKPGWLEPGPLVYQDGLGTKNCLEPTCAALAQAIATMVAHYTSSASTECTSSAACALVDTGTACGGSCGAVTNFKNATGLAKDVATFDALCKSFAYGAKCGYATPGCLAPAVACENGHCVYASSCPGPVPPDQSCVGGQWQSGAPPSGCSEPGDCEGEAHDDCDGAWQCLGGKCKWACTKPCVDESGSIAVIPNATECCPGLAKVPCDKPNDSGVCGGCKGAYFCIKCGDGKVGPKENICNCPGDVGMTGQCLPTTQSECLGGDPYGADKAGVVTLKPGKGSLHFKHASLPMNCCLKAEVCAEVAGQQVILREKIKQPYTACKCMCIFDIEAQLDQLPADTYTVRVWNEEQDKFIYEQGGVVVQ